MQRVLLVALALVLAGCGGAATPTATPTDAPTATATATPTETVTPTATATPTPTPEPTIVVTVAEGHELPAYHHDALRRAADYWTSARIDRYGAYDVADIVYSPNADPDDADVVIDPKLTVTQCGQGVELTSYAGCAPVLSNPPIYTARVQLASEQPLLQYRNTAIHEFGHVLGIQHGDAPQWIMSGTVSDGVTDASDRAHPWNTTRTLAVSTKRLGNVAGADRADIQAAVATYQERGYNITYAADWQAADILVTQDAPRLAAALEGGTQSQGYVSGLDYDADDDFEQWTAVYIYLHEDGQRIDGEAHIGYWLGVYAFGLEGEELPAEYRLSS